jgi:hypothetical protein
MEDLGTQGEHNFVTAAYSFGYCIHPSLLHILISILAVPVSLCRGLHLAVNVRDDCGPSKLRAYNILVSLPTVTCVLSHR